MNQWRLADEWRQLKHEHKRIMLQTHEREYRYEERGGTFSLKCWHDGNETITRGHIGAEPEWFKPILDTAVVGGHLKRIYAPPPDAIVWFTTDLDNNLNTFLELK